MPPSHKRLCRSFDSTADPGDLENPCQRTWQLHRLDEFCNFEGTLEKMIRDRLVRGIGDEAIQRKLLAEPDLTFERALAVAQGTEAAVQNLKEMKAPGMGDAVLVKKEPVNQLTTPRNLLPRAKRFHRNNLKKIHEVEVHSIQWRIQDLEKGVSKTLPHPL